MFPTDGDGRQAEQQPDDRGKANTMIVSFSATCVSVKSGSPSTGCSHEHHGRAWRGREQDQAGDVAVDLGGGQVGAKTWPMNSQPSAAIENGLTAQLMNRVTPMPANASYLAMRQNRP